MGTGVAVGGVLRGCYGGVTGGDPQRHAMATIKANASYSSVIDGMVCYGCYGLFCQELEAAVPELEGADHVLIKRVVDVCGRKIALAVHIFNKDDSCGLEP